MAGGTITKYTTLEQCVREFNVRHRHRIDRINTVRTALKYLATEAYMGRDYEYMTGTIAYWIARHAYAVGLRAPRPRAADYLPDPDDVAAVLAVLAWMRIAGFDLSGVDVNSVT